MIKKLPSEERGKTNIEWLKSFHSFSFGNYINRDYIRFKSLRVINEDWVSPSKGFGTHPHDNMEIITYVISGSLQHRDSMGNGSVINAGEVQAMSAGVGVEHSEFNPSDSTPVHLLQIWIEPHTLGLTPTYADLVPDPLSKKALLASADGRDSSIKVNQSVDLTLHRLGAREELSLTTGAYWIQIIDGSLESRQVSLNKGDGLAIEDEVVQFVVTTDTRCLVFKF